MKSVSKFFMIVCFAACVTVLLPSASADDWNKKTTVKFLVPVEVPGIGAQVLPPGTYVFRIVDSPANRHIVRILNEDETHVFTTILAIPNFRLKATDETVMTFKERAQGEPEAIRAWFYPGRQWGEEFVYSKTQALALAKEVNQPILYTPMEVATIEEMRTAPIEAVQSTGEPIAVADVVQEPPVEVAQMEEPALPNTGSLMPLLGLAGFLSLGAAGVMRKYSA